MAKIRLLYHVSPRSGIKKFRATPGHKFRNAAQGGVFVCPCFKSLIGDWALGWAIRKRDKHTRKRNKRQHQHRPPAIRDAGTYSSLSIYTIEVTEAFYQELRTWYKEHGGEEWWGEELFVPREWIDRLRIIKEDVLTYRELQDMDNTQHDRRLALYASRADLDRMAGRVRSTNKAARIYLETKSAIADTSLKNPIADTSRQQINDIMVQFKSFIIAENSHPPKAILCIGDDQIKRAKALANNALRLAHSHEPKPPFERP